MALIFIDTGAFIALISKQDNNHQKATSVYAKLIESPAKLITTNHIIDETCTWLTRYGNTGHKLAVEFCRSMLQSQSVHSWNLIDDMPKDHKFIIISTPIEIERHALTIFAKYDTAGFSFTDCTSFAVMQRLKIEKVFAFDHHFDILGFERV